MAARRFLAVGLLLCSGGTALGWKASTRPGPTFRAGTHRAAPRLDVTVRTLARREDLGEATFVEALVSSTQPELDRLACARGNLPVSAVLFALQLLPVAALADEGLRVPALSFGYFGATAVAAVWVGARGSRLQPNVESIKLRNALAAPFVASAWLFGLYYLIRYTQFDPRSIFALVTSLFGFLSALQLLQPLAALALGASAQPPSPAQRGPDPLWRGPASFGVALFLSAGLIGVYAGVLPAGPGLALLAGNLLALCSVQALLGSVVPETFLTAAALLGGLFFYDIFWVFKSDAMQTVAMSMDAPIKLQFPAPPARPYPFSVLGLGDLAVPGLFAAVCALIDTSFGEEAAPPGGAPRPAPGYLPRALLAYAVALSACFYANLATGHGQPALLYIVPALLGTTLGGAALRGELEAVSGFEAERAARLSSSLEPADLHVVRAAKAWVGEAVLPLNLCPYARAPFERSQYLYVLSNSTDVDGFIADFLEAADDLLLRPSSQVAATVLVAPRLCAPGVSEAEFGALAAMLEEQCADEGEPICGGRVGAAFFHPEHVFAGIPPDSPTHYERRAPFPCATILRSDQVGAIVKEGLAAGRVISKDIQDANARRLSQEGAARLRGLYARFDKGAD